MAFIILLGWWSFSMIERQIKNSIFETLNTALEITHQSVSGWVDENKHTVVSLANSPEIVALTKQLLAVPRTKQALIRTSAQNKLRERMKPFLEAHYFRGFFLIAPDNFNLASSIDANTGTQNLLIHQPELFNDLWEGKTIVTPPQSSDVPLKDASGLLTPNLATMFSGTAIRDENNEILALLTLRIEPTQNFTKIFHRGRIGETGESYAFNRKGLMVSNSRFDDQLYKMGVLARGDPSILNIKLRVPFAQGLERTQSSRPPLTLMAEDALKKRKGANLEGYLDYRGVEVVGAWLWSDNLNIGLATEQDYDEAYRPLKTVRNFFVVFCGLISASFILMALLFSRHSRKIRKERARYKSLFDNANDSIFLINPQNLNFVDVNQNAAKRLGYKRKELLTMGISDINRKPFSKKAKTILSRLKEKGNAFFEGEHVCRDGKIMPVEVSAQLIEHDDLEVIQSISRDISLRKKMEDTLRSAALDAEMANRSKTEFLANMSHELRTPLNAIIGFSEMMKSARLGPIGNPQYKQYAEDINEAGNYLLEVISDILDISQIEIGEMEIAPEQIEIDYLFDWCQRIFESRAGKEEIKLRFGKVEGTSSVFADDTRIKQVLLNLISNSIKFSSKGGNIVVTASTDGEGECIIAVSDEGIGISQENLETIFEKFEQVRDGHTRTHEGAGLGLPICKAMVELHGGNMSIQSAVGSGTTVYVKLPPVPVTPIVNHHRETRGGVGIDT